jgi:hypothetical protein
MSCEGGLAGSSRPNHSSGVRSRCNQESPTVLPQTRNEVSESGFLSHSLTIGCLAGTKVRLHWTFLVFLVVHDRRGRFAGLVTHENLADLVLLAGARGEGQLTLGPSKRTGTDAGGIAVRSALRLSSERPL